MPKSVVYVAGRQGVLEFTDEQQNGAQSAIDTRFVEAR